MKKILLSLFLLSTAFAGTSQNLVQNGDFEQYSGCPDGEGQIDSAIFWTNPTTSGGSPDYFNQCDTIYDYGVPDNYFGHQVAHSGVAYAGVVGYFLGQVWREYIQVQLTSQLIANQCYQLQMYISLADGALYTSDILGAYFSGTLIQGNYGTNPLPFIPQIDFNLGLNTDTINWILISANYTATGTENYLIIGNFKDDAQTNFLYLPGGNYPYSYFYIDDVSLTLCTGIEEQNNSEAITIYPNPVKDELHIQSTKYKAGDQIKIYDVMGKEIIKSLILNPQSSINVQSFKSGIYFLEINNGKEVYRKKFIKQ